MMDPQALSAAERLFDHAVFSMSMGDCNCRERPDCIMHDMLAVSAFILTLWAAGVESTKIRVIRN